MTFLFFICEAYVQPRRKRAKLKTVNQYWRDFKMLYRRSNEGRVINANDCEEIRKVNPLEAGGGVRYILTVCSLSTADLKTNSI